VRRNFPDRMVDPARRFRRSLIFQTSGSTGESLHFVRLNRVWTRDMYYSVLLRTRGLANIPVLLLTTPRCTAATCGIHEQEDYRSITSRRFRCISFLRHLDEMIGLPPSENILCAPEEYMEEVLRIMRHFAPCGMVVDPVYLGAVARYLKNAGRPAPRLRFIISSFELLTGSIRDLLEEVFGCEIYTQYGASECEVAHGCEFHRLHVRSNNVLVECIRDGRPAEPGELGRAVLTDLCNYNTPFIRYDIGDVIALGEEGCSCGRGTEVIECVHGRVADLITASGTDGRRVLTPLQADEIFRGVPGVGAYRLVQRGERDYHVSVMPDGGPAPDAGRLLERGGRLLGPDSRLRVERVAEMKPERSMKYRFVYSEAGTPHL